MDALLSFFESYLPDGFDLFAIIKSLTTFVIASLLLSFLGRMIFGKRSSLNHAISSAMGILCIYLLAAIVYAFAPEGLSYHFPSLPFVTFSDSQLHILSMQDTAIATVCAHVLALFILSFLVNLLGSVIPVGKSIISWYLLRFLTIVLSIILHNLVSGALHAFLPDFVVTYAPFVLLFILISMMLLGLLSGLLGLILTVINPILGGIYAFFFSNILGKQLSKSLLTTILICAVVYTLDHLGCTVIGIASATLIANLPLLIVLLFCWYLIGHLL